MQEILLEQWIDCGREKVVWAYRLDKALQKNVPKALMAMRRDLLKPYDPHDRFDDQVIYCSELLWRGWKASTGAGLGKPVKLGTLNWQPYRKVVEAIEGQGNVPLDREMITPRDLAAEKELTLAFP